MACETWTYSHVDARAFACLRNEALKQGFTIPDMPAGKFRLTVAGMNIQFGYQWDSSSRTLKLTCIDKPFIVSCATIKSYADKIVGRCVRPR